jgi:hypothetical protein
MTINPTCDKHKKELDCFGALLFGPSNDESGVKKFHIYKNCYNNLVQKL